MKIFSLLLFLTITTNCFSQNSSLIKGTKARLFQLKNKNDTIDFILVKDDVDTIKPVIIFCQGSTPIPLIVSFYNGQTKVFSSISHFNYDSILKDYHLIIISMPKTPIEVAVEKLDGMNRVVIDKTRPESHLLSYFKANYLENYVLRTKKVINFLYKQKWVDKHRIVLFGHSQGAKVALESAVGNKKIYKVGFSSGTPFGRTDNFVREERYNALLKLQSQEHTQAIINNFYEVWADVVANPNQLPPHHGDPNKTWLSFDKPLIPDFLKLKQPIYVTYGTEDVKSIMCDVLPFYFITAGKNNLTLKPYPGLDHNYSKLDNKRKPIEGTMQWQKMIDEFIEWVDINNSKQK